MAGSQSAWSRRTVLELDRTSSSPEALNAPPKGRRGHAAGLLKNFTTLVKEALPPEAVGKPLEIWFQDEARVGQKGTLTRLWARRGSRPRAPRDTRYEWAYIFGAVCPERAIATALGLPFANREAMNLHLREISQSVSEGAHALLVVDGAGWHTSAELEEPDNITLLILPPYAPELNPVENVWQCLR